MSSTKTTARKSVAASNGGKQVTRKTSAGRPRKTTAEMPKAPEVQNEVAQKADE
jgi:hypothetical protein